MQSALQIGNLIPDLQERQEHMAGKGDGYRPVDLEKFASNWDRIFANKVDSKAVKQGTKTPDRCPDTIDIEEQLESDRRKSAEVGGSSE